MQGQLTRAEKKRYAVRWWDVLDEEQICNTLSISARLFREWTTDKQKQKDEEARQKIYDMWLACHTQEAIEAKVGVPQQTLSRIIADFTQNDENVDLGIFRNFEPKLYSVWNFGEATNTVKHFGNIHA